VISWKNSFKRLNEEYELAKKKKQAVDNLYITGKISQFTRDSFNKDINATIVDIERQQKDLLEKMQFKTDELASQINTLESILANYEIQHVVGEIEECAYQRDVLLFTAVMDATRNELETIKQATMQLCVPVSTIQTIVPPELPVDTPTVAAPVMDCVTTENTTPVEISLPVETQVESAILETPIFEATSDPILEAIEKQTFTSNVSVTEEPVMESALIEDVAVVVEEPVMESALIEDVAVVVEEPVMEALSEAAPVIEEVSPIDLAETCEPIEIATNDQMFLTTPIVEESVMEYNMVEDAQFDTTAIIDTPIEEAVTEIAAEDELVSDVPLQVFEVTEQVPIEQTLEKVMEQLNTPAVEALTVEELTHDSHPSIAPLQAPSDIIAEAVSDGQIDESGEDTTE